jgi:hypothetical protein
LIRLRIFQSRVSSRPAQHPCETWQDAVQRRRTIRVIVRPTSGGAARRPFFAVVHKTLREEAKNAVHTNQFVGAGDVLHHPPDGFDHAGSFKPGFPIWSWYPTPQNRRRALIFLGADARNPTTEGDTLWVRKKPSRFSSPSTVF